MAKRFFYVAAGVLMLAIAFHLGAVTATAQGSGYVFGFGTSSACGMFARRVYLLQSNPNDNLVTAPIPGALEVVAIGGPEHGLDYVTAILADGTVYAYNQGANYWNPRGNVFGAATSATPSTWGSLKARYR